MDEEVRILYEDNHLLVVYKPRGILSQADGSELPDLLTILKGYLKEKYQKPGAVYLGLVHRLDINTCGIMVFAKTSKAASRLSDQIKNHEFQKKYLAVVEGVLSGSGTLENYLAKNTVLKKAYVDNQKGVLALLDYQVIKTNGILSLVDISLKTGRFHQIRAQFSAIGHPLYGDTKYGSKAIVAKNHFPLEAYYLSFYHPTTKEKMIFKEQNLRLESF